MGVGKGDGLEGTWSCLGPGQGPSMQTWPRRCSLHLKSFQNIGDFL